jgi:para-nitrobenzyl esterase
MKKTYLFLTLLSCMFIPAIAQKGAKPQVTTVNGTVEGVTDSGLHVFMGIPFAQPPVGNLRWREPQPVKNWSGIYKADHFRAKAMQKNVFGDMVFRADGTSEDCLYLNVWTPAKQTKAKLPVLVYFYGGGYVAGDGSEYRYDGASLARKGIVTVTVNYRLGIFGFFAHPELTAESPNHASGNYGLLDQNAALRWVKDNIAAFGGDPAHVTIAGESAGSISVCAQMASPLSKNLIAGAIGESGGMINPTLAPIPLSEGEQNGVAFGKKVKANSLAALRAMGAEALLDSASKPGAFRTSAVVDDYFLPKTPSEIYAAGEQAHVPLLAGWNSTEVPYQAFMYGQAPAVENYAKRVKDTYKENADEVMKLYPGGTVEEVLKSATALASDRFIVYSTWKWADLAAKTGGKPVYTYIFSKPRPATYQANTQQGNMPPPIPGAFHASEIEYALGNLATNKVYPWTADDYKVSATMEGFFANFIKTGNPNGKGLPEWKPITSGNDSHQMIINVDTRLQPEAHRDRYLFLDKDYNK